jgi:hypothetical protein
MCTEEGRLRTIGVALSFKVSNSRSWSKLEPADFRNGVRLAYHEGNIGTTSNVGVPTPVRSLSVIVHLVRFKRSL